MGITGGSGGGERRREAGKGWRDAVAEYRRVEGRTPLRDRFQATLSAPVEVGADGELRKTERPGRVERRDLMGEWLEEEEERERRERAKRGGALMAEAQRRGKRERVRGGGAEERRKRREGESPRERAHAEATQHVLGLIPPHKLPQRMGVGRQHADATSASHVGVPVTDFNCSAADVHLGLRLRLSHLNLPLPPRSVALAPALASPISPPRVPPALTAADLLPLQGDFLPGRPRSLRHVTSRIERFAKTFGGVGRSFSTPPLKSTSDLLAASLRLEGERKRNKTLRFPRV